MKLFILSVHRLPDGSEYPAEGLCKGLVAEYQRTAGTEVGYCTKDDSP